MKVTPGSRDLLESLPAILDGNSASLDTVLPPPDHLNVADHLGPGAGGHHVVVGAVRLAQGVPH